jgi:hypothetical protein
MKATYCVQDANTNTVKPAQGVSVQSGFNYTPENKSEQLFAEHGKLYYCAAVKHTVVAYEKYHCCLKSYREFSFCLCICLTNLLYFIQRM